MNFSQAATLHFIAGVILFHSGCGTAFSTRHTLPRFRVSSVARQNWLSDLWEEVIEFSTYGPAERKLLKAKKEKEAAAIRKQEGGDVSTSSFQQARQKYVSETTPKGNTKDELSPSMTEDDSLSLQSFQASVASYSANDDKEIDFDGYKLRDLMVEKWGVPLDINFQRGYGGGTVYCTVLPVAFGSSRCRHESELDYLMHLQGVIEVLQKYDNLDPFILFVRKTSKVPKPGVESAPYLMQLDSDALKQIL